MDEVLGALFPGAVVEAGAVLRGSDRTRVRRVVVDGRSVVVKEYAEDEGWAREAAGLRALAGTGAAVEVLGESRKPKALVFADAGSGPSLSDLLLGTDPAAASEGVVQWASALAAVHVAGLGRKELFAAELAARSDVPICGMADVVAGLPAWWAEHALPRLGLELPTGVLDELHGVCERLGDGPAASITPADTCPDNNVGTPDGFALIDFEGAQWQHIAWDAAYLTVPWPTCWCAWRMPDELAQRGLERYRAGVRHALPHVDTPQFADDLRLANAAWAVITSVWFVRVALTGDQPHPDPRIVEPRRAALLPHRLEIAAAARDLPATSRFARAFASALLDHVRTRPLALAPAFS
ncbi:phosphotransferase [Actinokineospora bangkokensis]|uniref:Aminoglycoside phosphotransferase domain-containing protein n=1 Tax=Actinokineospora bangkokensis TaxID=1193682 RepID=A0A1Q9LSH9_9PSEU|nr:phosphotransferase [Actinokineospora bangkokensis]OLR94963.1 hypothetical protein BJP25_08300 [Actinokineospora bangkokensis]